MARLPVTGATIAIPFQNGSNPRVLNQADLLDALSQLCPGTVFVSSDVERFYSDLCRILGLWSAEQDRLDSARIAKAISRMSSDLNTIVKSLSVQHGGLHDPADFEIFKQFATMLALDPQVGSRKQADALLASFQSDAAKIAHAGLVAAANLTVRISKGGRPPLDWHDDFTELLQRIARKAGVTPQLWKDPMDDNSGWLGWLFEASQKLEMFFPSEMRAETGEAAGKRLERSKKRLGRRHRQNPSRS